MIEISRWWWAALPGNWLGGNIQNVLFHLDPWPVIIGKYDAKENEYRHEKEKNKRATLEKLQDKVVLFHLDQQLIWLVMNQIYNEKTDKCKFFFNKAVRVVSYELPAEKIL